MLTPRAVPTSEGASSFRITPSSRAGLVLVGLMVSLPFLNFHHSLPLPTFYTEWMAFALGTAAMSALAWEGRVGMPPFSLGLIGLALVLLVQTVAGTVAYAERNLLGAGYALWAALLVWLGAHLRERCGLERIAPVLQGFIACGGFLVAITGFLLFYQIEWAGVRLVASDLQAMAGSLAQRNHFANYLACALASVVFLYGRGRLKLALASLLSLPLVLGLVLSVSRSAGVFLLLVVVCACWAFRAGDRGRFRRVALFSLALVMAFAGLAGVVAHTSLFEGPGQPATALLDRWLQTVTGSEATLEFRPYHFKQAWAIFIAHPLLGAGFGEFAWSLFERGVGFDGVHTAVAGHAHNALLDLLAETGLLGALCVIAPLLLWLRKFPWRDDARDSGWAIAVLAIQAAHSMVEYPLWNANFLGLTAVLLGAAAPPPATVPWSRVRQAGLGIVLAGCVTMLGVVLADYRNFEGWYRRLERSQENREMLSESQLRDLRELRTGSLFVGYYDLIASQLLPLDRKDLEGKLALNAYALRFFPLPDAVFRQAVLLCLGGDLEGAARMLARLATMYPEELPAFSVRLDLMARDDPALETLAREARRRPVRQGSTFAPLTGTR